MTASKLYRVESFVQGLAIKAPCRAHTTAPITLSGLQTINTHVGAAGDRILVKDQLNAVENGVYTMETSAWVRDGDFDGSRDVVGGTLIPVWDHTQGGMVQYQVTGQPTKVTPDTDSITFALFSGTVITGNVLFVTQEVTNFNGNTIINFTIGHEAISSSSGTLTVDYSTGQSKYVALTENITTVTFTNLPTVTGELLEIEFEILQDTVARTITWPASVKWAGGTEPDLSTVSSTHIVHLRSRDDGTTWLGTTAAEFA